MPCAENVESEATAGEDDEVDPGSRDAPSGSEAVATQCRRRRAGIWGNLARGVNREGRDWKWDGDFNLPTSENEDDGVVIFV